MATATPPETVDPPAPTEQPELFDPTEGVATPWHRRLAHSVGERVYLRRWLKWDKEVSHVAHLLGSEYAATTRRDHVVAASFAQWLGTNCGRGFIWEAEREIDGENELRRKLGVGEFNRRYSHNIRPDFTAQAELIAAQVTGHAMHGELVKDIASALEGTWTDARRNQFVTAPGEAPPPRGIVIREP